MTRSSFNSAAFSAHLKIEETKTNIARTLEVTVQAKTNHLTFPSLTGKCPAVLIYQVVYNNIFYLAMPKKSEIKRSPALWDMFLLKNPGPREILLYREAEISPDGPRKATSDNNIHKRYRFNDDGESRNSRI